MLLVNFQIISNETEFQKCLAFLLNLNIYIEAYLNDQFPKKKSSQNLNVLKEEQHSKLWNKLTKPEN